MSRLRNKFLRSQLLAGSVLVLLLIPDGFYQHAMRNLLATIFLFYIPGYWLSLWFFKLGELSFFERTMMSAAVSLAVVAFSILYLYVCGFEVTTLQFFVGCWIMIVCSFI